MKPVLAELLVVEVGHGLAIDRSSPDGEVDMYEAALADPDPATALARLRGHGFESGALRSWTDGTGVAQVTLHRFATVRDAELAALEQAHGVLAGGGRTFEVNLGFPEAFGASVSDVATASDDPFVAHVVIRPVRTVMMLVLIGGPAFGSRDAIELARSQSDLLFASEPDV
jgi:hypothetical protein